MTSTLYSQALDTDGGNWDGYTNVVTIAAAALTIPSDAILFIRATFQAGNAEALTITNAYVGHKAASGNAWDFAATPAQFLFSGSGTKTITAGTEVVSDWVNFVYNKTSGLTIAMYHNGGAGADTLRYKTGLGANINEYYKAATNEAATVVKSAGYTTNAGYLFAINKIEVASSSGGGFLLFF